MESEFSITYQRSIVFEPHCIPLGRQTTLPVVSNNYCIMLRSRDAVRFTLESSSADPNLHEIAVGHFLYNSRILRAIPPSRALLKKSTGSGWCPPPHVTELDIVEGARTPISLPLVGYLTHDPCRYSLQSVKLGKKMQPPSRRRLCWQITGMFANTPTSSSLPRPLRYA